MRLRVTLLGLMYIGITSCSPEEIVEPSAPIYEIGMQEAWIPMPDGVRLATDLYVPEGGKPDERFPVLLEYSPYRKTEERRRNYPLYSYFVQRGYLVARVDMRGTGNSEGQLIAHEYTDQENDDGEVVIEWLSKQPTTGSLGSTSRRRKT
jgi:hypothetical protein